MGGATEPRGCRREGRVYSDLQLDSLLFYLCPSSPQQAPNVVPPGTQLGPLGLSVKARKKEFIVKSSWAALLTLQEA